MQRVTNVIRPSPAARAVIAGQPAPSCAVVSDSELERLTSIVENGAQRQIQEETERREKLKEISRQRVANWPNTIEAQRLKKERARRERFAEEEERRKVIDEQEAQLAQAKQAEAIRKANMLLYEQNDRIKTFSSKLFLATVLEEREKQLHFKEERDAAARQAEARAAMQLAEELRAAEQQEQHKAKGIIQRTFDLKQAQLEQLASIRDTKIRQRDEDRSEGAMIKRRAEEAVQEEIELEKRRREQQKATARDLVAINVAGRVIKEERKKQELSEEEKILEFAKLKEQQMQERKRRVEEKRAAKLAHRQQLIDRQAQLLLELQQATEEREMRAMRDFDLERKQREEREEQARQKRQKEIDDFREQQRVVAERKQAAEEEARARMKAVWAARADRLVEEELEERRARRAEAERLQRFHLLQSHEKQLQEVHQRRKDFEEGAHVQNALKEEQEAYESYVNSVMHDYVSNGRKSDLVQMAIRRSRRVNTA